MRVGSVSFVGSVVLAVALATVAPTSSAVADQGVPVPVSGATARQSTGIPQCAWPLEAEPAKANFAYPDTDSTYWILPYQVGSITSIVINGKFTNARFFSIETYGANHDDFTSSNGVTSAIIDYQIAPNAGYKNPFIQTAKSGGKYQVTVQSGNSVSGQNVIPLAPPNTAAGSIGYVWFRVYLPKGGNFDKVVLPKVQINTTASTSVVLKTCPSAKSPAHVGRAQAAPASKLGLQAGFNALKAGTQTQEGPPPICGGQCPIPMSFNRTIPSVSGAVFPNEANAYLSAVFTPRNKYVVLVRGKAPVTPGIYKPGTNPWPWPNAKFQLRYYSMCNDLWRRPEPVIVNTLPNGSVDDGCRADKNTKLNNDGYYTYVVANENQKAAVSRKKNVTYVPTSLKTPHAPEALILRNMLPSDDFLDNGAGPAVQNVPQNQNPVQAAQQMGVYYPRMISCPLKFYLKNGPNACYSTYG